MRPPHGSFPLLDPRFARHFQPGRDFQRAPSIVWSLRCSAGEKCETRIATRSCASRSETRRVCKWNSAWSRRVADPCGVPRTVFRWALEGDTTKIENLRRAECYLPDNIHAAAENVREAEWTSRGRGPFVRRARAVLTSSRRSTRRPMYERKLLRRTQLRHSLQDSKARPNSAAYRAQLAWVEPRTVRR